MTSSIDERVAQTAPRINKIIEEFERGDSSQDIVRHDQFEWFDIRAQKCACRNDAEMHRAETTQKCVV